MKVPFNNLRACHEELEPELSSAISTVVDECSYVLGPHVQRFEKEFAGFCGVRECVGVANGTDALHLALRALGVGPGDEVIVPASSFIATAEAVAMAGAQVVFADVDPVYFTLGVDQIEAKLTSRTKAVIPVHLYGQPANMSEIANWAQSNGCKIVQDAAQAHGAKLEGTPLSVFGDISTFSFYPGKNLGALGDAGAVLTNDVELAKSVRMLANHGRVDKYDHLIEGLNSRMDGIQGAVLSIKLKHLEEWTRARIRVAQRYEQGLREVRNVGVVPVRHGARHVYHLFSVLCPERDALREYLGDKGISTGIHYPIALPFLKAYSALEHIGKDFPVAYKLQMQQLSLPIFPHLELAQVDYVVDAIKEFYR